MENVTRGCTITIITIIPWSFKNNFKNNFQHFLKQSEFLTYPSINTLDIDASICKSEIVHVYAQYNIMYMKKILKTIPVTLLLVMLSMSLTFQCAYLFVLFLYVPRGFNDSYRDDLLHNRQAARENNIIICILNYEKSCGEKRKTTSASITITILYRLYYSYRRRGLRRNRC